MNTPQNVQVRIKRGRPRGSTRNKFDKTETNPFSIMNGFVPDHCLCSKRCPGFRELSTIKNELKTLDTQLVDLLNSWLNLPDNDSRKARDDLLTHSAFMAEYLKKSVNRSLERCHTLYQEIQEMKTSPSVLRDPLFMEILLNTPPVFKFSEFLEKATPQCIEAMETTRSILDDERIFQKARTGKDTIYTKETRLTKIQEFLNEMKLDVNEYLNNISMKLEDFSKHIAQFKDEEHFILRIAETRDCLVNFWILALLKKSGTTVKMSEFPEIFKETINLCVNEMEHENLLEFKSNRINEFFVLKNYNSAREKYGVLIE